MAVPISELSYVLEEEKFYKVHSFTWALHNVLRIVPQKYSQFRSAPMEDSRPQLKLDLWGQDGDIIELSCLFSTSAIVCSKVVLNSDRDFPDDESFRLFEANKWCHLKTWYKSDLQYTFNDHISTESNLKIIMSFKVCDYPPVDSENSNKLADNIKEALNIGFLSDFVLKSNDQKHYEVHKIILASRSAVLKDSFKNENTERLRRFNSKVLDEVVSYIYTDKVTRLKDIPKELLAAADYYQLNGLKIMCEKELSRTLSVDNFKEMLELSRVYKANVLEQSCTKYLEKIKYLHQLYEHVDCSDLKITDCSFDP